MLGAGVGVGKVYVPFEVNQETTDGTSPGVSKGEEPLSSGSPDKNLTHDVFTYRDEYVTSRVMTRDVSCAVALQRNPNMHRPKSKPKSSTI